MRKILIAIITLLIINISQAGARPIISGISTNEINIDTKFTGAQILLFGAKDDSGDIAIVIRGPKKNYLINKKGKILGIWHNEERVKFKSSYSYYAFFSTNKKINEKLLNNLEIGKENIDFNISGKIKHDQRDEFKVEFTKILEEKELYLTNSDRIEFLDESLFKVMLKFPKNISSGVYTVEIYLIDDGTLLDFQAIPIYVNQVGFSARMNNMAYQNSVLYAVLAILIAVVAGWFANFAFNRFVGK
ncbi:MAG: TIGR02186 family protein [Proteobacteria bacterium]|nr:TIGR02186 family protein [Pseudomonadota bacterium]